MKGSCHCGTVNFEVDTDLEVIKQCNCSNGTSMQIRNLFYNVPARRNFLKSDKIETRHITE